MALLSAASEFQALSIDHGLTHQAYATADVFHAMALLEIDRDTGLVSPNGVVGSGAYFIGYCEKEVTTLTSTTVEIAVNNRGDVIQDIAVTGVTGDSDGGKIVYCTTDNILVDCTLVRPATDALPIGRVQKHISGTTCDIKLFREQESKEFSLTGAGRTTICLGHTDLNTVTAADVLTNAHTFHGIGAVVDFFLLVNTVTTDGDAAATFNLEINSTNIDGGTITTTDTGGSDDIDVKGARFDATAITGNNTYADGDTLSVEASTITDYTDGIVTFYVVLEAGVDLT